MRRLEIVELLAQNWGKGWEEQEAVWRWSEVVGADLRKLARPLHVNRGVLHLAVTSPVVANELRLWAPELLARLAQVAPKSQVKKLRFHIVAERSEGAAPKVEPKAQEWTQAEAIIPKDLQPALRQCFVKLLAHALAQEANILAAGGRRCSRCGVAFLGRDEKCPLCRFLPWPCFRS